MSKLDEYQVPSKSRYLELRNYEDTLKNIAVFNINELESGILIKVPLVLYRNYEYTKVECIEPDNYEITNNNAIKFDCHKHPWVHISQCILDLSVGLHIYAITFIHKSTCQKVKLYFGYRLQNTNVARPYDYMEKYRSGGVK